MKKFDLDVVPYPLIWPANSTYTVQCFKGSSLKKGAALGLKYHLFVRNWMLQSIFKGLLAAKRSSSLVWIYIVFRDTFPVGVSVLFRHRSNKDKFILHTFVKKQMRRKGMATLLINKVLEDHAKEKTKFHCHEGLTYSMKFYLKLLGDRAIPHYFSN